jgi:site-specific DNA recombinase
MVEEGLTEMDHLLKERITNHKADRESAAAALARAINTHQPPVTIPSDRIPAFGTLMRERLTTGGISFRKAYVRSIIDRIEVGDHQIRIRGRKDVLEHAVFANGDSTPGVRSFGRRWRTRQDSNLRPLDSESNTLSS